MLGDLKSRVSPIDLQSEDLWMIYTQIGGVIN